MIRGLVEKAIDFELSDEMLQANYIISKRLKDEGFISDIQTAMFARIATVATESHVNYMVKIGKDIDI